MAIDNEFYNDTAKDILKKLFGISKPTIKQVKYMAMILFNTWLNRRIIFDEALTRQEKRCLYFASQGKSLNETAYLLGITERTVREHRKEIMRKFHCKNITQAVSVGIKYGVALTEKD